MITHEQSQESLWRFIHGYLQVHGYGPSYDDMKVAVGHKSKSRIGEMLDILWYEGKIGQIPNRARCIEVLIPPPSIPRSPTGEPLYFIPAKHLKGPPQ